MHQSEHARQMAQRFRELVESSGGNIEQEHYDELALIIESGLDTALLDMMGKISGRLTQMAKDIQHDSAAVAEQKIARPGGSGELLFGVCRPCKAGKIFSGTKLVGRSMQLLVVGRLFR